MALEIKSYVVSSDHRVFFFSILPSYKHPVLYIATLLCVFLHWSCTYKCLELGCKTFSKNWDCVTLSGLQNVYCWKDVHNGRCSAFFPLVKLVWFRPMLNLKVGDPGQLSSHEVHWLAFSKKWIIKLCSARGEHVTLVNFLHFLTMHSRVSSHSI